MAEIVSEKLPKKKYFKKMKYQTQNVVACSRPNGIKSQHLIFTHVVLLAETYQKTCINDKTLQAGCIMYQGRVVCKKKRCGTTCSRRVLWFNKRQNRHLMCVDLRIRPSGSTPGCRYWAFLGLVMSTAGHCSNLRSEKLSRSWSKARTLYLETGVRRCFCRSVRPFSYHNQGS